MLNAARVYCVAMNRLRFAWKYELGKHADRLLRAVVWRLPHRLVMWSCVRVVAHATTGQYGNTVVPELTAMDALKRWDRTAP